MDDKEKAVEQLSGRVTESQKAYFNNEMEGSFSDKVAELIESYKVRVKDNVFNVEANKSAITQALNVIVKNMDIIEINTKNYVQDIKDDIGIRIAGLEENSDELNNASSENKALKEINQDLSARINKLANEHKDLICELTSEKLNAGINYDKLKNEYEELKQSYMELKIKFGDMKEDLTDKNIDLTEKLNQTKEEYTDKIAQLKDDHAAELAKLNKEANERINDVSRDYTELKIKADATISKLDKDLAVANSVIESKNDLIKRLEEEISSEKRHLENVIGPMAVYYSRRNKELESLLKTNGISFEPNNFQNGGREEIIEQRRKDKSSNKDEDK